MILSPWQLAIAKGNDLYDWQIEALEAFGRGYPTSLVTCNGAGKTTRVASAAVDWFFYKYPRGWLVGTSGSYRQLQFQTWPAIAGRMPSNYIVQGSSAPLKIITPQGGTGIGFSTKDPGKAEGWHPKIDPTVDPVMILIDEGKTVPDAIWSAFDRCTVSYSLYISSPGAPSGRFFESFHTLKSQYYTKQVPYILCPHKKESQRLRDITLYGEDSPYYKSAWLAQFAFHGQNLILDPVALQAAVTLQPPVNENGDVIAFFDFAMGGDDIYNE